MGNCFTSCFEVIFQSEYEPIPDFNEDNLDSSNSNGAEDIIKVLRSRDKSLSEPIIHDGGSRNEIILPQQFGKFYELGPLLGIGTTSKVYKVHRRITKQSCTDERPLACKIIDKRGILYGVESIDIDPLLQQLCREVEILKRIQHPNIVTFYDYMETRDKLFIITERLDGGELFEHILNNGPLKEAFACQVLYGVFEAVAYLHERGVIHRDIKAENLIFFRNTNKSSSNCEGSSHSFGGADTGELSLKLIDFGFSTVLRHELTGSFMGTGGYIAPEIRSNKHYSASVDSWSLGVLLYCTLSARLPFGISLDTLPSGIEDCRGAFELTFPGDGGDDVQDSQGGCWAGGVSESCKDLLRRLLEVDPIKRYTARDAINHPWVKFALYTSLLNYPVTKSSFSLFMCAVCRGAAESSAAHSRSRLRRQQYHYSWPLLQSHRTVQVPPHRLHGRPRRTQQRRQPSACDCTCHSNHGAGAAGPKGTYGATGVQRLPARWWGSHCCYRRA